MNLNLWTLEVLPQYVKDWGVGGHSYIIENMDVRQGLSNPYLLQTKILDLLQTNGGKFSKIYVLERRKMNF